MAREAIIGDLTITYERIDRPVKYPRLEFKTGQLVIIAPRSLKDECAILEKKKDWIARKSKEIEEAKRRAKEKYRKGNSKLSKEELKNFIGGFVAKYAESIGVSPGRVFFRSMKTKWGSCSTRGNLSFNMELRFLPKDLIEYVVYHEIIHLKERRHSSEFWRNIESRFPDKTEKERELMDYWFLIQEINNESEMPTANRF